MYELIKLKKSQRFSTLAELAKSKEQAAAAALGAVNKIHLENIQKLESLKEYRLEYIKQFSIHGKTGMDVSSMQTYKTFIEGIEQAIRNQQIQIVESEQQCIESKKIWQHVHMKTEIMNTTVERYKVQERIDDDHREQKEMDDRPHSKNYADLK